METGNIILGFHDSNSNFGFFKNGRENIDFPWENVNFSPTIWNSFCVSLNETNLLLQITINGQLVKESYCSVGYQPKTSNITTIGSQGLSGRFYGQITDFNFWNKPLTLAEMEQFSSGCNLNTFLQKLKPEYVLWSEVNIIKKGGSTYYYLITPDILCSLLSKNNSVSDFNMLFGYQSTYEASVNTCDELNGKILLQGNIDESFLKREKWNLEYVCSNRFWVFTNISEENKNNHELISEGHSTVKNMKCLYYDVSLNVTKQTGCKEPVCFVCQIPEVRLKYQVKSSWEHEQYLENNFVLVSYNGEMAFASLNGLNFLVYSFEKSWLVRKYQGPYYEDAGYLHGKTQFPIGLQTLTVNNNVGVSFQVKITDVSF